MLTRHSVAGQGVGRAGSGGHIAADLNEDIGRRLGRSITADDVVAALDEAYRRRGAHQFIRCDNGPELISAALKDWCRVVGTGTAYIEPGSPWQNPFVEPASANP